MPKSVLNPCGFSEWKPGPTKVNGSIAIKFSTARISPQVQALGVQQAEEMKAFSSWFMKYILPCQIAGLLLVYVKEDRVRSFCWKLPDCCHLSQTKSLFLTRDMGFTEWIRAVVILCEVHRYENRYYTAALIKFKPVTADSQKKRHVSVLGKKGDPVLAFPVGDMGSSLSKCVWTLRGVSCHCKLLRTIFSPSFPFYWKYEAKEQIYKQVSRVREIDSPVLNTLDLGMLRKFPCRQDISVAEIFQQDKLQKTMLVDHFFTTVLSF